MSVVRWGKSNVRFRPDGELANGTGSPSRFVGRWPWVFLLVVCLTIGGLGLERLLRPKEQSPPAKSPARADRSSGTPVPAGVSASAARLSLQELLEAARQLAARLEVTFPQDADALNLAATIYNELFRDSDKAMDCWERALEICPNSAEVHFNVGCSARGLGDYQKASSHFLHAHALRPEMGDVRLYLADSLLKLGEAERAIAVLQEAGDPRRYGAQGRLVLGNAYSQQGDFETAKVHFEAVLALEPKNLQAHHGLIKVMIRLKQPEQAKKHRDAVAELERTIRQSEAADRSSEAAQVAYDANNVAWWLKTFYRLAAEVYQRNGRAKQAEEMLLRAAQLRPGNP